jgi:DNA processing protein
VTVAERVLAIHDADFPTKALTVRPQPRTLFVRGDLSVLSRRMVAIVGARDPSPYGMKVAWEAAHTCARAGLVVISGMARGLDGQAHRAAIDAGGLTVGVLGCGLDVPYPRQNADLRQSIPEHGALMSEFSPGTRPAPWTFPQRNRLIAALADTLVVVEGRVKGGTSNTVEWVMTLNKTILAVPGRIDEELAGGPNLLIQQGATLYRGPWDVFDVLKLPVPDFINRDSASDGRAPDVRAARAELSGAEATLFDLMTPQPVHVDQLAQRTALDAGLLLAALSTLELQGLIKQLPGKHFALAS